MLDMIMLHLLQYPALERHIRDEISASARSQVVCPMRKAISARLQKLIALGQKPTRAGLTGDLSIEAVQNAKTFGALTEQMGLAPQIRPWLKQMQ
jgi:hypothetical protein